MSWLTPITRKRLARFKEMKRAHWSLWGMLAIYGLSLVAGLYCNGNPWLVHCNGKTYTPLLRSLLPIYNYYPEAEFLDNDVQTRPNYHALNDLPLFRDNPDNRMVFTLFPFGPADVIDTTALEISPDVTATIVRRPQLGTVTVRPDFTISRSTASGYFFAVDDDSVKGLNFTNAWEVGAVLAKAIDTRFRNQAAEAVTVRLRHRQAPEIGAEIFMTAYKPRSAPPRTVRLSLRETGRRAGQSGDVTFTPDQAIVGNSFPLWERLSDAQREALSAHAARRLTHPVDPQTLVIDEVEYTATFHKQDVRYPFKPTGKHWMGIDNAGRDVFVRIVYGLRIAVSFGLILVVVTMTLGALVGALQGYYGGVIDITGQRLTEIWSALPFLYVMILLGAEFGRSFFLLLAVYAVFNWIGISYYIRAEVLKLRRLPFVESAKCQGIPARKIIVRHILPNAMVPIITFFPFSLVGAVGSLAALDYLGFGLPPGTPSWGELLSQAQEERQAWWLIIYPSLALFTVMLLVVFIGEGVRNAFDPKRYSRME